MIIFGFDFGTTNSVFATFVDGRVISYTDIDDLPIPSIITYEGDRRIVGRAAKERLSQPGVGVFGNTVRSPKMLLEKETVTVDGVRRNVVEIVSDLMRGLVDTTRERIGTQLKLPERLPVVLTIPIDFKGGQRRALRAAATAAGLDIVQFVHEPFAALYGYLRRHPNSQDLLRTLENELLLVYDWGGGTLDITICRLVRGRLIQIDSDGTDTIGGDHFDSTIHKHVIERFLRGSNRSSDDLRLDPDASTRLLHDCERLKIDLSTRQRATLFEDSLFPDLEDPALDYEMTQAELEELTRPMVTVGLNRLNRLLERNGLARQEIALVLATGGMSRMPAIERGLLDLFGPERLKIDLEGGGAMAVGAAYLAADRRPLHLARSIELQVARSGYLPIIKAGLPMPQGGEINSIDMTLWCTDPRDGEARFHFVSPKSSAPVPPPHDERDSLGIGTLVVDRARRPFEERILLRAVMDEDLVLTISSESRLTGARSDELEIHHLQFGILLDESETDEESAI